MKKKYDFILPIGESCITAYNLRERNLQKEAYPFDWLMDFKLKNFVHCLSVNFSDFLLKENLEPYLDIPPTSNAHYKDKNTGILFVHCFNKEADLKDFDSVNEMFTRRIKRIQKRLAQSKKALLVYTSKSDCYDDKTLIQFYNQIAKSFPNCTIDLMYIVMSEKDNLFATQKISKHIEKIEMTYSEHIEANKNDEWKGIKPLWDKLLNDIELKKPSKILKIFFNILSIFLPNKELRHNVNSLYLGAFR